MKTISIEGRKIGPEQPPYIIAEVSANHNGSLERALETIEAAKKCGADAVKLQTYTPDTMTIDCNLPDFMIKGGLWDGYKLYDLYKEAQTPFEWQKAMFDHARKLGITVFSTPFDESAVDLLESLNAPAYKIASFELIDLPLIKYVASKGKPIIMSTGMGTEEEINEAVEVAIKGGCEQLSLLHCVSSYPAPVHKSNLRRISKIADIYKVVVGLSDHSLDNTVAIAGVALGASIVEKHFTLNRSEKGPDSEFSIEPDELTDLCVNLKNAFESLGDGKFTENEAEQGSMIFRRSMYFIRDIEEGSIIEPKDVGRIRPGMGLAPKYYDEIIGKKAKKKIIRGERVTLSSLA